MIDAVALPRTAPSGFGDPDFDRAYIVQGAMRSPKRTTSTITDVLRRWNNGQGDDTAAIAAATGIPQADVCRITAADQDRRHAAQQATLSRA